MMTTKPGEVSAYASWGPAGSEEAIQGQGMAEISVSTSDEFLMIGITLPGVGVPFVIGCAIDVEDALTLAASIAAGSAVVFGRAVSEQARAEGSSGP